MNLKAYTVALTSIILFACLGPRFHLKAHDSPAKITNVTGREKQHHEQNRVTHGNDDAKEPLAGSLNEQSRPPENKAPVKESMNRPEPVQPPDVETKTIEIKDPEQVPGPGNPLPQPSEHLNVPNGNQQKPLLQSRPCMPHEAPGYKAGAGGAANPPDSANVQQKFEGDAMAPVGQGESQKRPDSMPSAESQVGEQPTPAQQQPPETIPSATAEEKVEPSSKVVTLSGDDQVLVGETQEHPSGSPQLDSTEETSKDTTVSPGEHISTLPKKDDIMSFDEWKEKMLAEHSQQLKSKQLEAQSVSDTVINGKTGKLKASSSRHNHASLSCGAKILAANQEAQNPSSILTENKDQYMIQPCKAKKWFVVELCEPVQVRNLEIANLELFSSLPETFMVHVSDRYPSKEWKALGTFHARDERAVQTFTVSDEELFAKYMKVEMVSHYGSEHYCPLTLLRVYGVVEEEEEDGEEEATGHPPQEAADAEVESSNLFKSATDTVFKLVKNVLSPAENEEKEGQEMEDVVQMNTTLAKNASRVNDTTSALNDSQPCMPGDRPDAVSNSQGEEDGTSGQDSPIVRHMGTSDGDEEWQKSNVVTLIETPSRSLQKILSSCIFCYMPNSCTFLSDRVTTCGYYRTLTYVPEISCVTYRNKQKSRDAPVKRKEKSVGETTDILINDSLKMDEKQTAQIRTESSVQHEESRSEKPSHTDCEESKLPQVERTVTSPEPSPSSTHHTENINSESVSGSYHDVNNGALPLSSDISPSSVLPSLTEPEIEPSATDPGQSHQPQPTKSLPDTSAGTLESAPQKLADSPVRETKTRDQVLQSPPEKTVTVTDVPVSGDPTKPAVDQVKVVDDKVPEVAADIGQAPLDDSKATNGNGRKDIYAEQIVADRDLDLEGIETPDLEEPVQKLTAAGKQTTFMRLKNRIKALELNLNLSSRYLEELSQRYKKQMEEMYTSINSTINRLSNTSRESEDRDRHQQAHQIELQEQISRLTANLTALQANIDGIHSQVIERHLYLMIIEAIVFAIILTYCVSRGPIYNRQIDKIHVPAQMLPKKFALKPKTNLSGKASHRSHQRRNSVDATPPRPKPSLELTPKRSVDDIGVNRRSESEDGLPIVQPTVPNFLGPELNSKAFEGYNKKKKRKKNQIHQSNSSTQLLSYRIQGQQSHSKAGSSNSSSSCITNGGSSSLSKSSSLSHLHDKLGVLCMNSDASSRQRAGSASSSSSTCSAKAPYNGKSPKKPPGHTRSSSDVKPAKVKAQARLSLDFSKTDSGSSCSGPVSNKLTVANCEHSEVDPVHHSSNCNGASISRAGHRKAVLTKSGSAEGRLNGSSTVNGNDVPEEHNNSGNWKHWFPGLHKH